MKPTKPTASPLRAVIPTHVAAALVGVPDRAFAKRVRRGGVAGAVRGFESTGYVIGWRAMESLLAETLAPGALEEARRLLLGVRAGALRVEAGEFLRVADYQGCTADQYLDEELEGKVRQAVDELGQAALDPAEFDRWAADSAPGLNHRDVAVRLSAPSWAAVVEGARAADWAEQPSSQRLDLSDPTTALREAAAAFGDGRGRELSTGKFDDWAEEHGSPLRSGQLRSQLGGWNEAKRAAGLETALPSGRWPR